MDSTIDIKKLRDHKVLCEAGYGVAEAVAKYAGLKKKAVSKPIEKPKEPVKQDGKLHKVQVGSFSDTKNAEKLVAELKKKGYKPYIVQE